MKSKIILIFITIAMLFTLVGCEQTPRFEYDFTPAVYTYDDVYYQINSAKEKRYEIVVEDILKEKDKEDIYILKFLDSQGFKSFELELSESEYQNEIGSENNVVTCSYNELSLIVPCKDSKEFKCLLYETNFTSYSFEDDYVLYDQNNIDDEIEQFLKDIEVTQKEQFKEDDEVDTENYLVWVYSRFQTNFLGWKIENEFSTSWGDDGLEEMLDGFIKYSK